MSVQTNLGLKGLSPTSHFGGFETAIRSGESIYVINNSKPRSLLIMTVTDPLSGRAKTLEFYNTFIPFCLTDMLPRGVIEQSMELRTFLMKGILKMVSEKEALDILQSPKGKAEYERLVTSDFSQSSKKLNSRAESLENNQRQASEQLAVAEATSSNQVNSSKQVHPKLLGWESRLVAGDLTEDMFLTEFSSYDEEFTGDDCRWVISSQLPQSAKDIAAGKLNGGSYAESSVANSSVSFGNSKAQDRDYDSDFDVE